jgi:1-acyl-sn-glycerol-3-phosphate acyltransferase
MITAKKNSVIGSAFRLYHQRLLKKHFYKIHLRGIKNLSLINGNLSCIFYANHSNWWDGFIAYFLTHRILKEDDYLMMDIEQMRKYPFFKYIGVFSVDRSNPSSALQSIEYAASLLKNKKRSLWIFPQGEMAPQDKRPLDFFRGISKLTEKTGPLNIVPVALRYEFLMEQRPEIFISISKPVSDHSSYKALTAKLEKELTEELDKLRNDIVNGDTACFETVFCGQNSRNKTFD